MIPWIEDLPFEPPIAVILSDATVANPIFNGSPNGTGFILQVTDAQGCEARDTTYAYQTVYITLDIDLISTIVRGDSVQLSKNVLGGFEPFAYEWTPTTGLSDPTQLNTWASPDTTTRYTLLITDSLGCTATAWYRVNVDTTTSLVGGERLALGLYPNPAGTQFRLTEAVSGSVRVLDLTGRSVRVYPAGTTTFDVRGLPSGSYIVEVEHEPGTLRRRLQLTH